MKRFAAIAALAALTLPATAQAQTEMTPEATQAAVRYALPHLLAGVRSTCGPKLSRDGYLAKNGAALLARYSQGSEAAWPAARSALMEFGSEKNSDMTQMFAQMPDSALRPFIDAMISSMVATKIKADNCADVERGLELLAPLPAENIAGIIGFVIELSDKDKAPKAGQDG